MVWVGVSAQAPSNELLLVYTSAPRYDTEAWLRGAERFPAGAQLMIAKDATSRVLVAGFTSTADASVSFDGMRVLFAGKRDGKDRWQIWEMAVAGGDPKRITSCDSDCVRPFYLPDGRVVYARNVNRHFRLEAAPLDGGPALELTYDPGNALPTDVRRDGRILFEAAYPMGGGSTPEIYSVYSDGSGFEAYRCDHGAKRQAGKQTPSGDIVFASAHGLGRFTSALADEVDLHAPSGEFRRRRRRDAIRQRHRGLASECDGPLHGSELGREVGQVRSIASSPECRPCATNAGRATASTEPASIGIARLEFRQPPVPERLHVEVTNSRPEPSLR
jgi:hypothetical protein